MKKGKRILGVGIERLDDSDADISYLEQEGFEERLEAYRNGDFDFIGIRAVAEVQLSPEGPIQTIRSGGLWGIESDSAESHLREVAEEELAGLKTELYAVGFSRRAVAVACKGVI